MRCGMGGGGTAVRESKAQSDDAGRRGQGGTAGIAVRLQLRRTAGLEEVEYTRGGSCGRTRDYVAGGLAARERSWVVGASAALLFG